MSLEDGVVQLPWRGGRHGGPSHSLLCAQASFLCVHRCVCVGFPHFDRGAAGMLLLCRLWLWERGFGVPLREGVARPAGRVRLVHRGLGGRVPCPQPCCLLCDPRVMSTLGHRE